MKRRPVIGITMGDPAGIGPEIALKAALDPDVQSRCHPVIIGSIPVLEALNEQLSLGARLVRCGGVRLTEYGTGRPVRADSGSSPGPNPSSTPSASSSPLFHKAPGPSPEVSVLDLANCTPADFTFGQVSEACGRAAYEYIERAVKLAMAGHLQAVVTAPIHKVSLNLSGVPHPGHTEIFAALTGARDCAMMLVCGNLKVSHVTTHVALSEVPRRIQRERVLRVIRLTHDALRRMGIANPRLAVAGLNPHSGEGGLFGDEEEREIRPAVMDAQREGILADGPVPGDSVFVKALAGQYDAVVAMYHDQGHIPVKLLGFQVDSQSGAWTAVTGVNVTLGLPIVRTSVDHGVAFDIAGKGIARHESMLEAVHLAVDMAGNG